MLVEAPNIVCEVRCCDLPLIKLITINYSIALYPEYIYTSAHTNQLMWILGCYCWTALVFSILNHARFALRDAYSMLHIFRTIPNFVPL